MEDEKRQATIKKEITEKDVKRLLDLGRLLKSVLNEHELNELREILQEKDIQE